VVRTWLKVARIAIDFGRGLWLFFLCVDLFIDSFDRGITAPEAVQGMLLLLAVTLVVPALVHLSAQLVVGFVTFSRCGTLALVSVVFPAATFALGVFAAADSTVGAILLYGVGVVYGPLLWFLFLMRLGHTLGDHALVSAVRGYHIWFWLGVGLAAALLVLSSYTAHGALWPICWLARAGAGFAICVLLRDYVALLRLVTRTVARRAPVAHR
jgi:hypothetical protein